MVNLKVFEHEVHREEVMIEPWQNDQLQLVEPQANQEVEKLPEV